MPSKKILLTNVIAVIGCDGSGKSTLTADLITHLYDKEQVELLYLGQSSGNIGDWIKSLPLIGAPLGRYLVAKAKRAHSKKNAPPDTATMLVIYLLSLWRMHKFRRMLRINRRGKVVVTDRYPQAEVAGFYYDGAGLGAVKAESWFARKLVAREQKHYQWMAAHVPTLIIRLNIDAETAHARKPDHKLSMLQDKIAVLPHLHFNNAQIIDINGRDPYDHVLSTALNAIHTALSTSANSN